MDIKLVFLLLMSYSVFGGKCPSSQLFTILDEYYIAKTIYLNKNDISPPNEIMTNNKEIIFSTNSGSYILHSDTKLEKFKFKVPIADKSSFVFVDGKTVQIANGTITLTHVWGNKQIKLLLPTGYYAKTLAADSERDRIYFLSVQPNTDKSKNKIFLYDKNKMGIEGGRIKLMEVLKFDTNITAITVDRGTGNILMAMIEYNDGGEESWSLKQLEQIVSMPSRAESSAGIDIRVLEAAITQAGREIITLYEEAVMGGNLKQAENKIQEIIKCNEKLKKSEENYLKLTNNIKKIKQEVAVLGLALDKLIKIDKPDNLMKNLDTLSFIVERISKQTDETNGIDTVDLSVYFYNITSNLLGV